MELLLLFSQTFYFCGFQITALHSLDVFVVFYFVYRHRYPISILPKALAKKVNFLFAWNMPPTLVSN